MNHDFFSHLIVMSQICPRNSFNTLDIIGQLQLALSIVRRYIILKDACQLQASLSLFKDPA